MSNSIKIITYDLRAPGRNYELLYFKIRGYKKCAHVCESVWVVSTSDTCTAVRDNLLKAIDANDRLFVAELTGAAAGTNLICSTDYLWENP